MLSPIRGKEDGRGIMGFAVNRGAVNRGFTVSVISSPGTQYYLILRRYT